MPCTWLHKVGTLRSFNSYCLCLEQGSMRRQMAPLIPCCTLQPRRATLRWRVTSLQSSSWTHRTGTRCVGARGLCWYPNARSTCVMYVCVHGLVCAVTHVVVKQVSHGHVNVQSCIMPSESYPTLCLLVLVW